MSSLQSQADKNKEAMEEENQKALEVIFAYGYRCCVFKHNICGDRQEVPMGMLDSGNLLPPELFVNPGCPLLMSVKLIYVLSPFHMLFLSIIYPNSCKTHNISYKLGFVGFLMESK